MPKFYLLLLLPYFCMAQFNHNDKFLFDNYPSFEEKSLVNRRFKHHDIQPLLDSLSLKRGITITQLGHSIQGRSISMVSMGDGDINVLLWSQMHGDESTATASMFDMFNYLKEYPGLLKNLRVHFIPMLNPDGAEVFKRRNAIGIDLNRDALALQCPESKILKRVRDSLEADFGFNLHDQSKYYNPKMSEKPATISFLAPAFNREKDINESRGNAMRIIAGLNQVIQRYAKGQVARYSDEFEPRAFGDNMQKWGTCTILIESGGYQNDPEKLFIRKLNFVSILSALKMISNQSYQTEKLDQYLDIPVNNRKLFDLKIENLTFYYLGNSYEVDVGIQHHEIENKDHSDYYTVGKVVELGDLSTYYGYETLNARGLQFKSAETYPTILKDFEEFKQLDLSGLLARGYTHVGIDNMPDEIRFTPYPMNIVSVHHMTIPKNKEIPDPPLKLGSEASFLLKRNDEVIYAIINGYVYDLKNGTNKVRHSRVR